MAKLTVSDILAAKGKQRFTEVRVSNPEQAKACEQGGIDIISARISQLPDVRAAAPNTFLTGSSPLGTYNACDADAIRTAYEIMNAGGDAFYMCAALDRIKAVAAERIPVVGHVGFVPVHATWTGGFRAIGKTATEAAQVYRDTLAMQAAGVFAVEMEVVPHRIAAEISKRVDICVISMGSGTGCDCEYLFATDILGLHDGHVPRHAKVYRNQFADSVAAFTEFKADVDSGAYPAPSHLVEIPDDEFDAFMQQID